jgi:hypothetical protein
LDHFVPADRLVYSPSLDQLAYHHRDLLGFWQSSLGHRMYSMFVMAVNNDQAPLCTRQLSFQTVRTNVVRLVLEDRSDEDLKLSEVQFFAGTQELPRQQQWRLTSSDNPWEVQLAFDNSPVSWWSSGRRGERGIWLQVDFGAPREITRIAVEQPSSQRWLHLQLQISSQGRWVQVPIREEHVDVPPAQDLRRAVAAEMKASGVEWILIRDGDFGSEDLRQRASHWGAEQIARAGDFRLLKLE